MPSSVLMQRALPLVLMCLSLACEDNGEDSPDAGTMPGRDAEHADAATSEDAGSDDAAVGPDGGTMTATVGDSVADFSGVQGQNNWHYGYVAPAASADFVVMPQFAGGVWLAGSGTFWTSIGPERMH